MGCSYTLRENGVGSFTVPKKMGLINLIAVVKERRSASELRKHRHVIHVNYGCSAVSLRN